MFTLTTEILSNIVLPKLSYSLPLDYGPLLASAVLFSLPSFLLGMLSPFAIKLQKMKMKGVGVGKISGEVFFVSTFGSIFGSLIAGFFLIPNFGIGNIINGVGILLFAIGFLGIVADIKKNNMFIIVFLFSIITSISLNSSSYIQKEVVYEDDGLYQKITIFDTQLKGRPTRLLFQDAGSSSGIVLNSDEIAFDYAKYYVLYKLFDDIVENVLVIGGGAYTLPELYVEELSGISVDVAEIEPDLYRLSKEYFGVSDNPRIVNHIKDGRRMLFDTEKEYDVMFVDAYSSFHSIPIHMATYEFFSLSKSKLSNGGIFIANIIGDLKNNTPSYLLSEIRTFRKVFPNSYIFAVNSPRSNKRQNIIFLGIKGDKVINFDKLAENYPDDEILTGLKSKLVDLDKFVFEEQILLTDDYAPVDVLTALYIRED